MNKQLLKYCLAVSGLLLFNSATQAQQDTYVAPTGNMVTHTGAQTAIFGNLINDARGVAATAATANAGVNHNGGGTVYLYRRSTHGTGNSRIYDGPLTTYGTGTDNYNANGKAVRFFNLITDNTTGTATASGTNINSTSGSGHIQMEQEVCVSNLHTFTNGIVWTPRGAWKHAYLHYDAAAATYTGAGASNTAYTAPATNMQVDGYVAKTGNTAFTFPIGDGVYTRFSGVSGLSGSGTMKSAFFKKNAQLGTAGISGTSASTGPMNGGITAVNTTEFWDIDGTVEAQMTLHAFNTGGYSNWNGDFSAVPMSAPDKIVITAWDAWENLGIATVPTAYSNDGAFTTAIATNPDAGHAQASGLPFSAYTWATAPNSMPLPVELLAFTAKAGDCKAMLNWQSGIEENITAYTLQQSTDGKAFTSMATVNAKGSNSSYEYSVAAQEGTSYYRLMIGAQNGDHSYSEVKTVSVTCKNALINVYPNPASDKVFIQINADNDTYTGRMYNDVGQVVLSAKLVNGLNEMALGGLSSGIYMLQVANANGIYKTIKVNVQH